MGEVAGCNAGSRCAVWQPTAAPSCDADVWDLATSLYPCLTGSCWRLWTGTSWTCALLALMLVMLPPHCIPLHPQLLAIMDRYKLDLVTAGRNFNKIRMAIASGFFFHAARKDAQVLTCRPANLDFFKESARTQAVAASGSLVTAQQLDH